MLSQLLSIAMLIIPCCAAAQLWQPDFPTAQRLAKAQDHNLVVVFSGSDWCAPCIKLERDVWEQASFIAEAKQALVFYKADFPRRKANQLAPDQARQNATLAERYNTRGSFPLVVVLTPEGEVIKKLGYQKMSPLQYLQQLTDSGNE